MNCAKCEIPATETHDDVGYCWMHAPKPCKTCNTPTETMDLFPGGICLACNEKKYANTLPAPPVFIDTIRIGRVGKK